MYKIPQSIFWGFVPGFFTAIGGSYKDTLFEPFEPLKFFRSPIVCFIWYVIIIFIIAHVLYVFIKNWYYKYVCLLLLFKFWRFAIFAHMLTGVSCSCSVH